jgi:hypothetical protein
MSKRVLELIASAPYSNKVKTIVNSMAYDLSKIEKMPLNKAKKIRMGLGNLAASLSKPHKQGDGLSIVQCCLFVTKRLLPDLMLDEGETDRHIVTDHAFCSAVRRLGHDMQSLKDRALEEALENGLFPVKNKGWIVTFLPPQGDQNV